MEKLYYNLTEKLNHLFLETNSEGGIFIGGYRISSFYEYIFEFISKHLTLEDDIAESAIYSLRLNTSDILNNNFLDTFIRAFTPFSSIKISKNEKLTIHVFRPNWLEEMEELFYENPDLFYIFIQNEDKYQPIREIILEHIRMLDRNIKENEQQEIFFGLIDKLIHRYR